MLVPLKWLEEFVDHGLSADELAHSLTMSGLEVDGIEERHGWRDHVLVAKVLETRPHPQADKLQLALVDYGEEQGRDSVRRAELPGRACHRPGRDRR